MKLLTKNEKRILDLFRKDMFLSASIRELMKLSKSKSYPRIYEAVNELIQKGILTQNPIGNAHQITLTLSRSAIIALSYLDDFEDKSMPHTNVFVENKEITDYLIIATGSYARGNATKKSDLDMVIIVPDHEDITLIQKKIEQKTMLLLPEVHLFVIRKKDFVGMLTSKEENFGTEIFKNLVILKNPQLYYELIKEAIDNGFKG